jgi:hypothetical protein
MKLLISIVIMMSLCCQNMVRFGIIAWYEINKEYVAKNLCENRDKPQLNCCGKCILKKKLNSVDQNSTGNKQLPSKFEKIELAECVLPTSFAVTIAFPPTCLKHFPSFKFEYHHEYLASIFHPPASLS